MFILYFFNSKIGGTSGVKRIGQEGNYIEEQLIGQKDAIVCSEDITFLKDNLNQSVLKLAQTKIGDKVAYSLTYNYDVIPKGEMTATHCFTGGEMASVLINGYPSLSYSDLGLQDEEEAYVATQLAVYELVSKKQYKNYANGEFSLDKITYTDESNAQKVERIVSKAKEIYQKAIESPYSEMTDCNLAEGYHIEPIDNDGVMFRTTCIYKYNRRVY